MTLSTPCTHPRNVRITIIFISVLSDADSSEADSDEEEDVEEIDGGVADVGKQAAAIDTASGSKLAAPQRMIRRKVREVLSGLIEDPSERRALRRAAEAVLVAAPWLADPRVWNGRQLREAVVPAINAHGSARAVCALLDGLVRGVLVPVAEMNAELLQPAEERNWLAAVHGLLAQGEEAAPIRFAAGGQLFATHTRTATPIQPTGDAGGSGYAQKVTDENVTVDEAGAFGATNLRLFGGHIAVSDRASGVTVVILANRLSTAGLGAFGGGTNEDGLSPSEQILHAVCAELGIGRIEIGA
ncbi:hypothetical protein T492DRAFT_42160 [Pavlovales sp. CCMP2436]|nr:hypothetical protein T492DRAFT_42160 [Pavlovales sp. CCMP2436]